MKTGRVGGVKKAGSGGKKTCVVLLVKSWEDDEIPADTMNHAIQSLIRQNADEHQTTDTDLARRAGMSRQQAHNMRSTEMDLSIPITRWCEPLT